MYNTELYDDLLQSNRQCQYSLKEKTKTLVICGAFLLNTSVPLLSHASPVNLFTDKLGSDGYIISSLYFSEPHTWSDIKIDYTPTRGAHNEILDTFDVMKKLTFLEGDEIAEEEADLFFSQVTIKTKKILVNKKA